VPVACNLAYYNLVGIARPDKFAASSWGVRRSHVLPTNAEPVATSKHGQNSVQIAAASNVDESNAGRRPERPIAALSQIIQLMLATRLRSGLNLLEAIRMARESNPDLQSAMHRTRSPMPYLLEPAPSFFRDWVSRRITPLATTLRRRFLFFQDQGSWI